MKIKALLFSALILSFLSSCTVEQIDPDLAGQIVGTYKMDTYVTHSGESTPNADDKIVINRTDDTHVNVLIDYASSSANNVELPEMSIVKSGDKFMLDKSFTNADATGEVEGDVLTFSIEYTNGNYVNITAIK